MPSIEHEIITGEVGLQRFGCALAQGLRGGETILLDGTLGTGKTTFSRAVIQTLCGSGTEVASPTFMLLQEYDAPAGFTIQHYDLYRVKHAEELLEIGLEDALGHVLALVEWPGIGAAFFPQERLEIRFYPVEGDDTRRRLQLTASGGMVAVLNDALAQWKEE